MNYCPTGGKKNCMQMYSVEGQNHTNKTLTGAFECPASSVEHWRCFLTLSGTRSPEERPSLHDYQCRRTQYLNLRLSLLFN